eukprot:TRINITY_DN4437_c0_g1_i1.p2 TRINITY_DN4437_c0_g1~~TRINITY_DN4437_c0_g1_i1.p2  ORF type:complete len:52 (-),score=3.81 TRINITY_DN4437_c0_g1_i1:368-523(-)
MFLSVYPLEYYRQGCTSFSKGICIRKLYNNSAFLWKFDKKLYKKKFTKQYF